MGSQVPTRDGDVVIMHHTRPSVYDVWLVIEDGQQERDSRLFQPMRVADQDAAQRLAHTFVADTGTVFLVEPDLQRWTTITS